MILIIRYFKSCLNHGFFLFQYRSHNFNQKKWYKRGVKKLTHEYPRGQPSEKANWLPEMGSQKVERFTSRQKFSTLHIWHGLTCTVVTRIFVANTFTSCGWKVEYFHSSFWRWLPGASERTHRLYAKMKKKNVATTRGSRWVRSFSPSLYTSSFSHLFLPAHPPSPGFIHFLPLSFSPSSSSRSTLLEEWFTSSVVATLGLSNYSSASSMRTREDALMNIVINDRGRGGMQKGKRNC